MNGKQQVMAYRKLIAPCDLSPGDLVQVQSLGRCRVIHVDDPLVTVQTEAGRACRVGWRVVRKVGRC